MRRMTPSLAAALAAAALSACMLEPDEEVVQDATENLEEGPALAAGGLCTAIPAGYVRVESRNYVNDADQVSDNMTISVYSNGTRSFVHVRNNYANGKTFLMGIAWHGDTDLGLTQTIPAGQSWCSASTLGEIIGQGRFIVSNVEYVGTVVYTPIRCTVDRTGIPSNLTQVTAYANWISGTGCQQSWDSIMYHLVGADYIPPTSVLVTFRNGGNPASTLGTHITINYEHIRNNPLDFGLFTHELAHVAQAYPRGGPGWMIEGIADLQRYQALQPPPGHVGSIENCRGGGGAHYLDGYECAAAFLQWMSFRYRPPGSPLIYKELNTFLHSGSALNPENIIVNRTGRSLPQLWSECLSSDCQGGRPSF